MSDQLTEQLNKELEKERLDKLLELEIKFMTATYDKSSAYANLIIISGYASFFGLWSITSKFITRSQSLWVCILILISAIVFVFFEIIKMAMVANGLTQKYRVLVKQAMGKSPHQILVDYQEFQKNADLSVLKFLTLWRICLVIAVSTGLLSIGILMYSLIRALCFSTP